ncbi:MAG: RNB domain-containing ribonuclease [Propioniciclava sp.]
MPRPTLRVSDEVPAPIRAGYLLLRDKLEVPDAYPAAAVEEAGKAAAGLVFPDRDLTGVPFITIDPATSTDLDQAVHIERRGTGYRIHYAIADLTGFVAPGGPLDEEVHRRGVTLYAPQERTPLHPPVLAEGAASLLAGQLRSAHVWTHDLDASGERVRSTVVAARVRSREQLSYREAQNRIDAGSGDLTLRLLQEVGELRLAREAARGGVSLPIPEQQVSATASGWELTFRAGLPVEQWNAQVSLLTGMAAASLMLDAGVGILRTLPPIRPDAVARLRRVARALGIRWDSATGYPAFVRTLAPAEPRHAAMLNACTTVFRGAGYAAFDGAPPDQPLHGAMNAPYAHCTAPLRRLVDRYASQICVAVCADDPVPGWVREALPRLPDTMAATTRRASSYERGIVNLTEALVLTGREGESFDATVIGWAAETGRGEVQIGRPAIQAPMEAADTAAVSLGSSIPVRLTTVDLLEGRVGFSG